MFLRWTSINVFIALTIVVLTMSSVHGKAEGSVSLDSPSDYEDNPLWPILVETVHSMVMYPHHKAYVRDTILRENPDVSPQDLALRLNMPLGEALVILHELKLNPVPPPE